MKILFILNERPAADEKAYNAIRIAAQFQKDSPANQIFIYLIADGVFCALANAEGVKGILNVEEMLLLEEEDYSKSIGKIQNNYVLRLRGKLIPLIK